MSRNTKHVCSRYQDGFVIAEFCSAEQPWKDKESNSLVGRLVAKSEIGDKVTGRVNLIVFLEVEIIEIKDGEDDGYFEPGTVYYTLPFPEDSATRKKILRLAILHLTEKIKSSPTDFWGYT